MGTGSPEEQRVGICVGAHIDGVALHQRAAALGYGEPQRSPTTVLRYFGSKQPRCSPAPPAGTRQRTRAAQKVREQTVHVRVWCSVHLSSRIEGTLVQ